MDSQVVVTGVEPSTVVITLTGSHDLDNCASFGLQVAAALGEGCESLVIDLSEVTFIDSVMAQMLVRVPRTARQHGVQVALVAGENALVRKLVDLWTLAGSRAALKRQPSSPLPGVRDGQPSCSDRG